MKERAPNHNVGNELARMLATNSALVIGILGIVGALTKDQRQAILVRDGNRCRAPHPPEDGPNPHMRNGTVKLEVHHISPQRWEADIGIPVEVRDRPENLLTVCEVFHSTHIHPDMAQARKEYGMDKDSYHKAFQYRNELVEERKPYWNTVFDAKMFKRARKLTEGAKAAGWVFPGKGTKAA